MATKKNKFPRGVRNFACSAIIEAVYRTETLLGEDGKPKKVKVIDRLEPLPRECYHTFHVAAPNKDGYEFVQVIGGKPMVGFKHGELLVVP